MRGNGERIAGRVVDASIVYGALLGVFLLGLLTRRVGEIAAMCGMSVGLALLLYVRFATPIAFTWYVLIGASANSLSLRCWPLFTGYRPMAL